MLASLDPELVATAVGYTRGNHWVLLWDALVTVVACWLLVRFAVISRVDNKASARSHSLLWRGFSAAGSFFLVLGLLRLPWDLYIDWYRERAYGLGNSSLSNWLTDWGLTIMLDAILLGVFFGLFYLLLSRVTHWRALWVGVFSGAFLTFIMLLTPTVIAPLFNSFEPAEPGPVRNLVNELAGTVGIPPERVYVYDGSSQSNRYTASVSGLFGSARILLSDTMFDADPDLPAIRAVVAHEIGHYVEWHTVLTVVFYAVSAGVLFWLLQRLFPLARQLTGAAPDSRFDDPAGLPLVIILVTVLGLLSTPLLNGFVRTIESRADLYSLRLANEPEGLARALLRTADYRAPSPSLLEEFLFYDHPSIERRVRQAMQWQAEQ